MIDALEEFLLRAARLEYDAAEGYQQLAQTMDELGKDDVAALFRKFARYSRLHLEEMLETQERELGRVLEYAHADIVWPSDHSPENPLAAMQTTDVTARGAVEIALEAERAACDFYSLVAGQSGSARVQELAQEFAEEESGHVDQLKEWLAAM